MQQHYHSDIAKLLSTIGDVPDFYIDFRTQESAQEALQHWRLLQRLSPVITIVAAPLKPL